MRNQWLQGRPPLSRSTGRPVPQPVQCWGEGLYTSSEVVSVRFSPSEGNLVGESTLMLLWTSLVAQQLKHLASAQVF